MAGVADATVVPDGPPPLTAAPAQELLTAAQESKVPLVTRGISISGLAADYSWLPSWAYHSWVDDIAQERTDVQMTPGEKRITMFDVCGPAAWYTTTGFAINWIFLGSFQFLTWHVSQCAKADSDEGRNGKEYVESPHWLFYTYIPIFLITMGLEWSCFKALSIALVQWVKRFSILGVSAPFSVWLIYEFVLTSMASTSRPSQSLFIIQTLRTFQCEGGSDLSMFWRKTEQIIPTHDIFGFDVVFILVIAAWGLMWVEALYAMLLTIPIEPVTYGPRSMKAGYEVLFSLNPCASKLHDGKSDQKDRFHIWHADAVQHLADPAAMHSIRSQYMEYSLKRATVAASKDPAKEIRAFQIVGNEAHRVVPRFAFQLLQMCCALEVHICLLHFDAARAGGAENLGAGIIGPMITHFLSAMLQVGDAAGRVYTIASFRSQIMALSDGSLVGEDAEKAAHNSSQLTRALAILCVGIVVYCIVLLDVFLKLYQPILTQSQYWPF